MAKKGETCNVTKRNLMVKKWYKNQYGKFIDIFHLLQPRAHHLQVGLPNVVVWVMTNNLFAAFARFCAATREAHFMRDM